MLVHTRSSCCLLGLLLFVGFSLTANVLQAERLNVLLICVDDLKPAIGCFGDKLAKTPNLDRLASHGVAFESAYCNQAVCSPSRNSLMTSLRPQTLGIYDLPTHFRLSRPEAVTLAQHFKASGYRTESLGKIFHTGHGNIDDKASWSVESWKPKAPTYQLPISTSLPPKGSKNSGPKGAATEMAEVADSSYGEGQLADELVQRLHAAAKKTETPFFIAGGFLKPHLPFVAPKKYWDMHNPMSLPMPTRSTAPDGAPSYAPTNGGELRNYADIPSSGTIDEKTTRHLIHGYYAATSYMDAQVGRVIDAMDELKLWDKTVVVLWGDHGWHLGDHGMWCKHSNYEQATRIPVIVSAPQGRKNQSSQALIETVDIFPTLCDLAGIDVPVGLDGKSFAQVVQDPTKSARAFVTHVYPRNQLLGRAIRTERYRLVEWKTPGGEASKAEFELYDYAADPGENQNLAAKTPDVVADLKRLLAEQPEAKPQFKPAGQAKRANADNPNKGKKKKGAEK